MENNLKAALKNWKNIHEMLDKIQRVGTLRIWILHVLTNGPKNGVEIMDAIQEHHEMAHRLQDIQTRHKTGEEYNEQDLQNVIKHVKSRPSPGSVYPMLKKMVVDGLLIKMDNGKYDLTDKGKVTIYEVFGGTRHKDGHDQSNIIESALIEIDNYVSYLEDVQKKELIPYEEVILELIKRLKKIVYSLLEE